MTDDIIMGLPFDKVLLDMMLHHAGKKHCLGAACSCGLQLP